MAGTPLAQLKAMRSLIAAVAVVATLAGCHGARSSGQTLTPEAAPQQTGQQQGTNVRDRRDAAAASGSSVTGK